MTSFFRPFLMPLHKDLVFGTPESAHQQLQPTQVNLAISVKVTSVSSTGRQPHVPVNKKRSMPIELKWSEKRLVS